MELKEILKLSHDSYSGFWVDYDTIYDTMDKNPKLFTKDQIEQVKYAFIVQKLALIQKEISDALTTLRTGKKYKGGEENLDTLLNLVNDVMPSHDPYVIFRGSYLTHIKGTFEDELASVFIKLSDFCKKMDIDIEKFVRLRIEFNTRIRDDKHNKLF